MKTKSQNSYYKKPFLNVLEGNVLLPPPVWMMRQAGRYLPEYRTLRAKAGTFLDLCLNPDLACQVTLQPLQRFSLDAAIVFSDILLVPYALGESLEFREGVGPLLPTVSTSQDLKRLKLDLEKIAPVGKTLELCKKKLPPTVSLIGFVGAPWTLACYMIAGKSEKGQITSRHCAFQDPDFMDALFDILIDGVVAFLKLQVRAGAEVVQIFDSWAGVFYEEAFERWCLKPIQRIVQEFKKEFPNVPVIGYPRGVGVLYKRFSRESGVDAVSLDETIPPQWAAQKLFCPLQGNLDPALLLAGGPLMREAVTTRVKILGKKPYVFNLGHGIFPATPIAHVEEMIRVVRES